jgi:hypothetical protein
MQVDLEVEDAQVAEWPRFQQAAFQGRRLKRIAFALGGLAGFGLVMAFFIGVFSPQSVWPALLVGQTAGLWVLVAGLQSAWWVTQWRRTTLQPAVDISPISREPVDNLGAYERFVEANRRACLMAWRLGAADPAESGASLEPGFTGGFPRCCGECWRGGVVVTGVWLVGV